MKHILPLILMFIFCQLANSQTVVMKPFDAPAAHSKVSYLKEYSLLQTSVKDIQKVLNTTPGNIYKLILRTPEHAFQLELFEYALSAPDRIRTTGGIDAIKRLPARTDLRTFKGTVNGINNSLVSMTIADGFLHLMIDDRSDRYFIDKMEDPDKQFISEEDVQQFVLYKASDVLPVPGVSCGATALNKGLEDAKHQVRIHSDSRNRACLTTFIALAADFTMILKHGGPNGVDNFMMANLADVQTVFDDEFYYEIEYVQTATWIADMPNTDPFNGINDIFAELDKFRQVGDILFAGAGYVVATCWTAKFTSGAIGVAYLPGVCYADKYNICSSFIPGSGPQVLYLTLQAHELGHNWNCQHDQLSAGTIMQATINPSTIWSFMSKDAVKNYIEFQGLAGGCLPFCPGSGVPMPDFTSDKVYGCQPMTVKFKD
ncbi:MAG: M12 family metallo-peptidase, partial [Saprospiraceae bacterium]